jgi:Flp pilus assembly pilin Flp
MKMLQRIWKDEAGFVVSAELILVATIAVLGLVAGLATVRNSITNELADFGGAIDRLSQSYAVSQVAAHSGDSNGATIHVDLQDFCNADPVAGTAMGCITFNGGTAPTDPIITAANELN